MLRLVFEDNLMSEIGRACLIETGENQDGGQDADIFYVLNLG